MKLVWKSTKTRINKKSIEPISIHLQLTQQWQEWNWLEKKLSNHLDKNEDSNIN